MSNNMHIAEGVMGAVQNLASRGGYNIGSAHSAAGSLGSSAINTAAAVAPLVIAKAAVVTAALAPIAVPAAAVTAAGYGLYRLGKWLFD